MKHRVFLFALFCGVAHAEGARIGLELESEKDNKSGIINNAITIAPGWEFSDANFINRIELLIEANRDNKADSDGLRAKENKFFVRFRHDGELMEKLDYYVRGGIGHSYNNQHNFSYAYIEPGIEYKINDRWEWVLAFREINSIDGTAGERVGKFITGPNFDLNKNNEFELRYVKGNGDKDLKSIVLEYVYKFE